MFADRKRLREAHSALDQATSHDAWHQAALAVDALTGAAAWRDDDASPHYDADALRDGIADMQALRAAGDGHVLIRRLTEHLHRNLGDLGAAELYSTAFGGTKRLVSRYLDESERSLLWLADTPIPGLSPADKRVRFRTARKVFGRSALLLSGGATWGFHHLGVVKALHAADLLPHVLSGASTGAMVAAGVCARNDAELTEMFADTDQIRLDGLVPRGLGRALKTGSWLDPERLYDVLQHNVGNVSFSEAYRHSGRALNISVSPTRKSQKPRLLCWLTAPDVLVARAALASSALPLLFPPVELAAKDESGETVPYISGERWVDGSLHGDLPKLRLSRLHNVNHFIVSQTNPHVLPFVSHGRRRGVRPAVAGLASATLRTQGVWAAELAHRAAGGRGGAVGQLADHAHALVTQDYRGDIDIHPRFDPKLLAKVMSNPTRDDLTRFIQEGERSVWPQLVRIDAQTRISRAFAACLSRLAPV